jgi:hypothetical protein
LKRRAHPRWPLALCGIVAASCARIHTTSEVQLVEREGVETAQLGDAEHVTSRRHEASWVQLGPELIVELHEHTACKQIKHVPVVRVERIHRRSDHSLAFEYIIAAGAAGFSAFAFSSPRNFGGRYVDTDGTEVTDPRAGYRVGGVFAAIAAIGLFASVYDTIRVRDTVLYADAYAVIEGGPVPCLNPRTTLDGVAVTFIFEDFEAAARTDPSGRTRIVLPGITRFIDAGGHVRRRTLDAALRIDEGHAVRVAFSVPYADGTLATHGHVVPSEAGAP